MKSYHLLASPLCFNFHTSVLLDKKLQPTKIGTASYPLSAIMVTRASFQVSVINANKLQIQ